jgi:hypothetical protein
MNKIFKPNLRLIIAIALLIFSVFSGCKKQDPCKDVVQGDFELVD